MTKIEELERRVTETQMTQNMCQVDVDILSSRVEEMEKMIHALYDHLGLKYDERPRAVKKLD